MVQAGVTWAQQPNDSQGNVVVDKNGVPQAYGFTAELGSKITDFAGIFAEYGVGNQFPGWKGASGPIDVRAVHFFHPGNSELLVGIDSNNDPSVQDVWNTVPSWQYPYYGSPQAPGAPGGTAMSGLAQQTGSVGVYALFDRQFYAEVSMYRVGTGFFRWMTGGTSFDPSAGPEYLKGFNPYWRAYWTKERGASSLMVGTFGMHSNIYPVGSPISGPTDAFADTGFDTQYQYLGERNKLTLRGSYTYEQQSWDGSFAQGISAAPKGNFKTLNLSSSYALRDSWTFNGSFFVGNGSNNAASYAVSDPNGNQLSAKPNTTGYVLEVDRTLTQNVIASLQYTGFTKFNGLTSNIDGIGRKPSDNNAVWLSVFFAF